MKRINFPSYDKMMEALREVASHWPEQSPPVIAGGLAMQFYGSPRFTQDVDLIALALRDLEGKGQPLTFGGTRIQANNGVEVDVIVRDDEWATLYFTAFAQSREIEPGIRVAKAEFLVAVKMVAGRDKDEGDIKFLLANYLVDFNATEEIVREHLGKYGVKELRQLREIAIWEKEREEKTLK